MYDVPGNVEICGEYPTSLRLKVIMLGEGALTCWLTLWGIEIYWLCFLAEPTLVPWRTEQLDCVDNSFVAPVSNVTCN